MNSILLKSETIGYTINVAKQLGIEATKGGWQRMLATFYE